MNKEEAGFVPASFFLGGIVMNVKKIADLFVSSKKSSTFASRLLSKVYKRLVFSVLKALCPGAVKMRNLKCFLVVIILKKN